MRSRIQFICADRGVSTPAWVDRGRYWSKHRRVLRVGGELDGLGGPHHCDRAQSSEPACLLRSLQHLSVPNVAIQAACGDAEGEVTLHFEPGYTVSSSVVPFTAGSTSVLVAMRRLDDILRDERVGPIDMMKIDVEGAEELVLAGGGEALARTERVILETTGATEAGVRSVMGDHGFIEAHEEVEHWAVAGLKLLAFQRAPSS